MPTDSLWSFCMAVNIYLTFYRRYSAEDLKKLEKWYFLFCYGLPLILATTLSLIKTAGRGRIYGPALVSTCCRLCPADYAQHRTDSSLDMVLNLRTVAISTFGVFLWSSLVGHTIFFTNFPSNLFHRVVSIVTFAIYATAGVRIWRQYGTLKPAKDEPPANRAMGVTRSVSFDVTATAAKGSGSGPAMLYSTSIESQHSRTRSGLDIQANKHNAMRSYLRYSFLFFIAMVATWVWICSFLLGPLINCH